MIRTWERVLPWGHKLKFLDSIFWLAFSSDLNAINLKIVSEHGGFTCLGESSYKNSGQR